MPYSELSTLTASERTRFSIDLDEITGEKSVFVCKDSDYEKELDYLKSKVEAGAQYIITQMCFDAEVFQAFVINCRRKGIFVPILPGIMSIVSYGGFKRMTKFCKSRVPEEMLTAMDAVKDDENAFQALVVQLGVELVKKLVKFGVDALHFYTLNTSAITSAILEQLEQSVTLKEDAVMMVTA